MNLDTTLGQLETAQLVRHLIEEEPAYIFKHALVQDTAYDLILKNRRRDLHRIVARANEQVYAAHLDEHASELAYHYSLAGEDAKTVEYAIRAGDRAARTFAQIEARAFYHQALDALGNLPATPDRNKQRAETLTKLVSVSLRAEGPAETLKRLAEAETLARPFAERTDATREDRLRLARIQFWQGHAFIHHNNTRAAIEKMRQVLAVAQAENDPHLLAVPASVIGRTLAVQGHFDQAAKVLSNAITALDQAPDEIERIMAHGFRGFAWLMQGNYQTAQTEITRARELANAANSLTGLALAQGASGMVYLFANDIPHAIEFAQAMMETAAKSGDRLHAYMSRGFLAWAQIRAGNLDEAETIMTETRAIADTTGGRLVFADWFIGAQAERALQMDDYAQAIDFAQLATEQANAIGGLFSAGLAHRIWAQALACQAPIDWKQIEAHLNTSLEMFQAGDAKLEIARTHRTWGQLLQARDDTFGAREHFEQALPQLELAQMKMETEETQHLIANLK